MNIHFARALKTPRGYRLELSESHSGSFISCFLRLKDIFDHDAMKGILEENTEFFIIMDHRFMAMVDLGVENKKTFIISENILSSMTMDELRAIFLHEYHHIISNKPIYTQNDIKSTIHSLNLINITASFTAMVLGGILAAIPTAFSIWLYTGHKMCRMIHENHAREHEADEYAANTVGSQHMITSLETIRKLSPESEVVSWTHPSISSRIEKIVNGLSRENHKSS